MKRRRMSSKKELEKRLRILKEFHRKVDDEEREDGLKGEDAPEASPSSRFFLSK